MRLVLRYGLLLLALLVISFALPRSLPGDPLESLAGGGGLDAPLMLSPEAHARLLDYYGLDRPLPEQMARFLGATLRGDLGFSISLNQPVNRLLLDRLPWTALLVVVSLGLAMALGCATGLLAGFNPAGLRKLSATLILLGSLPEFVVGIGLILAFGVLLPILPMSGARTPFQVCAGAAAVGCAADLLQHAALPVLTLALVQLPAFFLVMRAAALGEVGQGYIVAARARGLSERTIVMRHVGRNAILPVLTLLGLRLGLLLGGVVIVETLFAYPGIGELTYHAALARDFPLLQAVFLLGGVGILVLNAAADLMRHGLDPRLRQGAQR
jgi:peptide/nickel transport system permease protein